MPLSKSQYRAVKKVVHSSAEKKLVINSLTNPLIVINQTEKYTVTPIGQGDDDNQRIGNRVTLSKFELRGQLNVSVNETIRLMIVQAKDGTFTDTDVLADGSAGPFQWVDYRNANKVTVP